MRELSPTVAGKETGSEVREIRSPYDGTVVSRVKFLNSKEVEAAAEVAKTGFKKAARMRPEERARILQKTAELVEERFEEFVAAVMEEAGKPVSLARQEVSRCLDTLKESAWVAAHPPTEIRDLGGFGSGRGRLALVKRVPLGPVLAITPFNFPLNLVAHKLGPAIAAGCSVLLKPASQTPSPALLLAKCLEDAGLDLGIVTVAPTSASNLEALVASADFPMLTFTGSAEVGWELKRKAWRKRVALELGGNAAVVVEPDAGDLPAIAERIAKAATAYAGQSCISVQRVMVHESIYMEMKRHLASAFESIPTGDPKSPDVLCGPMIDEGALDRVEKWIRLALEAGGRLLTGGERQGTVLQPTLLEEVPADQPVVGEEVFAPVATLFAYEDFDQALLMVNDSRFGLQAGIFTSDSAKIRKAWDQLEVGGVIHGDVPTWRTDPMPYGGVKDSGIGREGPFYAYLEMTEPRLLVWKGPEY